MKRLFKHFFQTILLIAFAWVVIQIPHNPNMVYWNMAIWGLIFCLLIGIGIYLYRGHKKGLFALLLLFTLFYSPNVFAGSKVSCTHTTSVTPAETNGCESESDAQSYYQCLLQYYYKDFCSEKTKFDVDTKIRKNESLDEETVKKAVGYADTYDKAAAAGFADKSGVLMHQFRLLMSDAENQYDCARDYLDKVAEYKKKKYEEKSKTVQDLLKADSGKCWPCGIVHTLLYAMEKVTLSLEETLASAALKLLGIMFLFWILVKVLLLIGQFGTANNAEFFTDFLIRSFLAIIAAALLSTSMGTVYRLTFSPFLDATLAITEKFLDPYKDTDKGMGTQLAGSTNLGCSCCPGSSDYSADSDCNSDSKGNSGKISECKLEFDDGSESVTIFEKQTKQHLLCTVCKIYKETAPLVASGRILLFHSWSKQTLLNDMLDAAADWLGGVVKGIATLAKVPKPFCMWVLGITLIVVFSWLAAIVAFRLLDIFLRLGFAILLTPFLVTTFVFPISRQYTKRGWDFLAHAALSIMAIGMGISLVMSAFMVTLPSSATGELKTLIQQTSTSNVNQYAEKLMNAFGVYSGKEASKGVSTWYITFYLIMVCFFGISLIKASQVVIEGLSGLSCGIPPIAGAAVMGAIRAALAPFRMIKNVALDWLDNVPVVGSVAKAADSAIGTAGNATGVEGGGSGGSGDHGIFASTAKFAGEATGKAVETTQKAVGTAEEKTGQGAMKLGGMLSATVVGSIIGVPLMVVGAALHAKGTATKATAGLTGAAVKKTIQTAGKAVQRVWNRVKRTIKNRMKKMVKAAIKKPFEAVKNLPKNIANLPKAVKQKFLKATRRMRAKRKYRRQKASGHGPANWKPTRREGSTGGSHRPSDAPQPGSRNPERSRAARTTGGEAGDTREDRLRTLRRRQRTANLIESVDSSIDSALNTAEDHLS